METKLAFKFLVILPLIFFADYLLMVVFGCISCFLGKGDGFFCGPYCIIGKILLPLSVIYFLYLIFPDIKRIIKNRANGQT